MSYAVDQLPELLAYPSYESGKLACWTNGGFSLQCWCATLCIRIERHSPHIVITALQDNDVDALN